MLQYMNTIVYNDISFSVNYTISGQYIPASIDGPEEHPEVDVKAIFHAEDPNMEDLTYVLTEEAIQGIYDALDEYLSEGDI